jgi:hypothetical protein
MARSTQLFVSLTVTTVAAVLLCQSLSGQHRSSSDNPIIPVIGTVKAISGNQIAVESGERMILVATDAHTEVWKGKTSHDLSLVQIGDDFAGRCRADASGRLVADLIELNVVNFFGVITDLDHGGERFEMFTNPKADPQSGYEKKKLKVVVDADTIFGSSAQEDLKVGRDVQMVGVDLRNGTTRATWVVVYEGNRPVRMRDTNVMPVTGPPKQPRT